MDKEEIGALLNFLSTASWDELFERQKRVSGLLDLVVEEHSIGECKFCLKLIDQEIAARYEVLVTHDKTSSKPST